MTDASGVWLAVMALCLAATLAIWLMLVFLADRSAGKPQENSPHREVVGGTFEARHGGRQVMPDPTESILREPDVAAPVPGQRPATEAERTAAGPRPG